MNNLPKVVTQLRPEYYWNPRPTDRKSNALPIAPPNTKNANMNRVVLGEIFACVIYYVDG